MTKKEDEKRAAKQAKAEKDRAQRFNALLGQVDDAVEDLLQGKEMADLVRDAKSLPPELADEIRRYAGGEEDPKVAKALDAVSKKARIFVRVLDDGREARIEVLPHTGLAIAPGEGDIWKALSEAGVRFGILEDRLAEVISRATAGEAVVSTRIAFCDPPAKGADGRIEFAKKPASGFDGDAVAEGDVVGTIVPPRPGKAGVSVLDRPIPAPDGVPATYLLGDGLTCRDDRIVAARPGMLRKTVDARIQRLFVDEVRRIAGNLDAIVGDVKFPGSLIVVGDVHRGRVVEARTGIEIGGTLEGAVIRAQEGDIHVAKGIQAGAEGIVSAGRGVLAKFIENATIYARGDVIAERAILNSTITTGGRVVVTGKKGTLIGGTIRAREGIEAEEIGGEGARTRIFFGLTLEALATLEDTDLRIGRIREVRTRIRQMIGNLLKDKTPEEVPSEIRRAFDDLKKKELALSLEERRTVIAKEDILRKATAERKGELLCKGRLHGGVRIRFGDVLYDVHSPMDNVRLRLGENGVSISPAL